MGRREGKERGGEGSQGKARSTYQGRQLPEDGVKQEFKTAESPELGDCASSCEALEMGGPHFGLDLWPLDCRRISQHLKTRHVVLCQNPRR